MITKRKTYPNSSMPVLTIITLAAILLFVASCTGGNKEADKVKDENSNAATENVQEVSEESVRTNILYIGVNNPLKIDVPGYEVSDLEVIIDNGKISGNNGEYNVNPIVQGTAIITISSKGEEIETREYVVEAVSDPVAKVGGKTGGEINKEFLLEQDKVTVEIENFTLDIEFRITAFTISVTKDGNIVEEKSDSNILTAKQKKLIESQESGQIIVFSDIQSIGPDGAIRNLNSVEFTLQ